MDILQNLGELKNNLSKNLNLENIQNNFLQSNIGKIANAAIDIGLKIILPDQVENEVIEVKDALITGGIDDAISTAVDNAIELGKNMLGIGGKQFDNIGQAQSALISGGITKGISSGIDVVLDKLNDSNILSDKISGIIKEGKDVILSNVDVGVKHEFSEEMKAVEKIEKYIVNWEKCYKEKDINGMNKEFNKIQKQMKKIMPLEKLIKNVNKIENLNELINNNKDFDFNSVYLDLAGAL